MGSVVLEDERTIDELKLSHADELTLYNLACVPRRVSLCGVAGAHTRT